MRQSDEEQGAFELVEAIEEVVNNPQKASRCLGEKTGLKGIIKTILAFIKDYKNKDPKQSKEDWILKQYTKPEYAMAWKGANAEKERAASAERLANDIEDYENAKKSLKTHIALGGTRVSWLAEQIEIGAANNGKEPAEYAKEISAGLNEAKKENRDFLLDSDLIKEAK